MIKKRTSLFTLLEVIIAAGLTMVILSSLAFFYRQVSHLNSEMDKLQYNQFELLYAENRLSHILTRSISNSSSLPRNSFYFFTKREIGFPFKIGSMTLFFTFDNCVKLNKDFSYQVLGQLFIDEDKRLTLAMWPSPRYWEETEDPPIHTEIIMENVEDINFEFYIPPDMGPLDIFIRPTSIDKGKKELEPEPRPAWLTEWRQEYKRLPAMIKMHLKRDGNERATTFAFPLPNAKYHVIYKK